MNNEKKRKDAPTGVARVVRTAGELARLADVIVPAYVRGNATVEGYVKVAHRNQDGANVAPERSKCRTAQLNITCLEPIVHVLDTAYGTGQILSGRIRDNEISLAFDSLAPCPANATRGRPSRRADTSTRGGILAVLALDGEGAPLQRAGTAQPDGRTAVEVARALDRLRQSLETSSFQVEITMSTGGAIIRASADATVVVVVEPGVALEHVLSLVPDPTTFLSPSNGVKKSHDFSRFSTPPTPASAADFSANGQSAARTNGAPPTNGASKINGAASPHSKARGRGTSNGTSPSQWPPAAALGGDPFKPNGNGSARHEDADESRDGGRRHSRFGVRRWAAGVGQRLDVVKWAVERWSASGDEHVFSAGERKKPWGSLRGESTPPAAVKAPPTIDRSEVENVTTKLLRAAEEYIGPRILDRLIVEASPGAWAWQNRRVVLRADAKHVASTDAEHIYREIRGVFGRGAYVSNALRDFNFDAWLSDVTPGLTLNHRSAAETAFMYEVRA